MGVNITILGTVVLENLLIRLPAEVLRRLSSPVLRLGKASEVFFYRMTFTVAAITLFLCWMKEGLLIILFLLLWDYLLDPSSLEYVVKSIITV